MSFGFSISDIVTLVQLTKKLCDGWRGAGIKYKDLAQTLESSAILLEGIKHRFEELDTLANVKRRRRDLKHVLQGCEDALEELHVVWRRYKRMRHRERLAIGMRDLSGPKERLVRHNGFLTTFLMTLEFESLGKHVHALPQMIERMPQIITSALPVALGQVLDARAADTRTAKSSVMTTYGDDDKRAYRELRRTLRDLGIKDADIRTQRPRLVAFMKSVVSDETDIAQSDHAMRRQHSVPPVEDPKPPISPAESSQDGGRISSVSLQCGSKTNSMLSEPSPDVNARSGSLEVIQREGDLVNHKRSSESQAEAVSYAELLSVPKEKEQDTIQKHCKHPLIPALDGVGQPASIHSAYGCPNVLDTADSMATENTSEIRTPGDGDGIDVESPRTLTGEKGIEEQTLDAISEEHASSHTSEKQDTSVEGLKLTNKPVYSLDDSTQAARLDQYQAYVESGSETEDEDNRTGLTGVDGPLLEDMVTASPPLTPARHLEMSESLLKPLRGSYSENEDHKVQRPDLVQPQGNSSEHRSENFNKKRRVSPSAASDSAPLPPAAARSRRISTVRERHPEWTESEDNSPWSEDETIQSSPSFISRTGAIGSASPWMSSEDESMKRPPSFISRTGAMGSASPWQSSANESSGDSSASERFKKIEHNFREYRAELPAFGQSSVASSVSSSSDENRSDNRSCAATVGNVAPESSGKKKTNVKIADLYKTKPRLNESHRPLRRSQHQQNGSAKQLLLEYRPLDPVVDGPLTVQVRLPFGFSVYIEKGLVAQFHYHFAGPSSRQYYRRIPEGIDLTKPPISCQHGFPSATLRYPRIFNEEGDVFCGCQLLYWSVRLHEYNQGFLVNLREMVTQFLPDRPKEAPEAARPPNMATWSTAANTGYPEYPPSQPQMPLPSPPNPLKDVGGNTWSTTPNPGHPAYNPFQPTSSPSPHQHPAYPGYPYPNYPPFDDPFPPSGFSRVPNPFNPGSYYYT